MTTVLDSLQAIATAAARPAQLIRLQEVVHQLAFRLQQPVELVARHVLQYLQLEGAGLAIYRQRAGGVPTSLPVGRQTRAAQRQAAQDAMQSGGLGAAMMARRLAAVPEERGVLLESLLEWWCSGRTRPRSRGADEVLITLDDAARHLGFEVPIPATVNEPAAAEPATVDPAPLVVEVDQLREGAPRFDAACVALCRERHHLEGSPRPMQQLMRKYGMSDGHLRKCIRRGRELIGPVLADMAVRSVFDQAAGPVPTKQCAA